jgi:RND family efflux transporter MFP subunit
MLFKRTAMVDDNRSLTRPFLRRRLLFVALALILCIVGVTIYFSQDEGESRRLQTGRANVPEAMGHRPPSDSIGPGALGTPIDVQVMTPVRRDLTYSITLPATLSPLYQTTLYAKVSGYLKWIGPDKGDWAKKDQVVAIIDAPEVEEQYQQAVADYKIKKITFERLDKVWKEAPEVIAKQDVDVAEAAYQGAKNLMQQRAALRDYTKVRAPFDGIITARFADPGALIQIATTSVTSAMPLFTLMDLETIRIYTNVPQEDTPAIKPGTTEAILTVNELPGRQFKGVVTRTTFALDPSTRSLLVEIDVSNTDHALQPGTYGQVTLLLHQKRNALVIPAGAIMTNGAGKSVFIVENDRAVMVPIRTGISDGRWVEVTEGLTGTEEVIAVGRAKLTEGAPVKASPYSLPEGKHAVQKFERRSATGSNDTPAPAATSTVPATKS